MSPRGARAASAIALVLAGLAGAARAGEPPSLTEARAMAPGAGRLAIRCGSLIDDITPGTRARVTVVIEEGRIRRVSEAAAPDGVPVLDLGSHTCLPGLIDLHTHITDTPENLSDFRIYLERPVAEHLAIARRSAATTLEAGFTTIRDVGTYVGWLNRTLRDEINRGETPGPRMQIAPYYLTIPGSGGGTLAIPGVPDEAVPDGLRLGVARGPAAFRRRAELAVAGGADLLKVIASGAVLAYGSVPGAPEMTSEELAAVVEVAHAAGLRVAAHAHGAQSIREALLAGVDTIEHASLIDDEGIELARRLGVPLVMDIYNGDYIDSEGRRLGWADEFLRKNLETVERQREAFRKAYAAGVTLPFGTDSAVYPHGWNARQFAYMVRSGMTPMQAIQSATSVAARVMGWEDLVGALVAGRYGDLIAVEGNPLEDVTLLERVAVVVKGGRVVRGPGP